MDALIVGGGMITHDQLLPSLLELQRLGEIGAIGVCGQHGRTVRALAASPVLRKAFPRMAFEHWPREGGDEDAAHPALFHKALAALPPRNLAVIALPDHLHFAAAMAALAANQHVLSVKPLVLRAAEAEAVEREALARELLVAVEYHKRFDDRSLMARRAYREGAFGEFRLGSAWLLEKWSYRHSKFQEWFEPQNSDAFTYIGCHYADLVHFITGLTPASVSLRGILDRFPNGREGYLWTDARIVWSNGACLNVQNALGFPDAAPGSNAQGMTLYCSNGQSGGLIRHSDQYRGVEHAYAAQSGEAHFSEPSPDYFQYVERGGEGLTPVGYGYRSVAAIVRACACVEAASSRRAELRRIDEEGLLATAANSRHNERLIEAARESLLGGGREVAIKYG